MAKQAQPALNADQAEPVLQALTDTVRLLSETAGHLVENAVPLDNETGVPESFNDTDLPVAMVLSERAATVARAAPVASLAAPEFAQSVPLSAPT